MCINKTRETPFNDSKIRWKVLKRVHNGKKVELQSPYKGNVWHVGSEKRSIFDDTYWGNYEDQGIHVFLTKEDAIKHATRVVDGVVVELKMSAFIAGGTWDWDRVNGIFKNETWRRAKLLKVYSANGVSNITSRYL